MYTQVTRVDASVRPAGRGVCVLRCSFPPILFGPAVPRATRSLRSACPPARRLHSYRRGGARALYNRRLEPHVRDGLDMRRYERARRERERRGHAQGSRRCRHQRDD